MLGPYKYTNTLDIHRNTNIKELTVIDYQNTEYQACFLSSNENDNVQFNKPLANTRIKFPTTTSLP